MNIFKLRDALIEDYSKYVTSFIQIRDQKMKNYVEKSIGAGLLWPEPLIQLNPSFEPGKRIDELVAEGVLHRGCDQIFRRKQDKDDVGSPLRLYKHQEDAVRTAKKGQHYVLTTGTGSGKSLAYIIPIVDEVLRSGSGGGIKAIVVYPMNALANSQKGELEKFLKFGFPDGKGPVTFERYTGQENDQEKRRIMSNPPHILLTNYVMLELILTRPDERRTLVNAAQGLRFLVLDEMHTYRGRQGADVSMLVRRVREALAAYDMQCIGTSATLAGMGSLRQQCEEVAELASKVFGDKVYPENVITETLRRATKEYDFSDPQTRKILIEAVKNPKLPETYEEFSDHPLASWIESNLGLSKDEESARLVRSQPRSLKGEGSIGHELSQVTQLEEERCVQVIQQLLLRGNLIKDPLTKFPAFAFRLHQFISRGDTVYASIEDESKRYFTIYGQKLVPGNRDKLLFPLTFCRECGHEYYVVRRVKDQHGGAEMFIPRDFNEPLSSEEGEAGFLYLSQDNPWPAELDKDDLVRLPEDWLEQSDKGLRVKSNQQKNLPEVFNIRADGKKGEPGQQAAYIKAPFKFCLNCGVSYGFRQENDFAKLTQISSGGRSTDTTILSLSLILKMKNEPELLPEARKLLSFTDNRQDASLQAGHFNDFVEVMLLRSALYRALKANEPEGISHDSLTTEVFKALNLPFEVYAKKPDDSFFGKKDTDQALREVLGYRIYRDLKRGWRITSPNLEQVGLLKIEYEYLEEVCQEESLWEGKHAALAFAEPERRKQVAQVLLDHMRRELVIDVSYLDKDKQDSLREKSRQRLIEPWALDENEELSYAYVLLPRPRIRDKEGGGFLFFSPRGGYGQYLRRRNTFPHYRKQLTLEDIEKIIDDILDSLNKAGLIIKVIEEKDDAGRKPGYQLRAASLKWKAGDGTKPFHDRIRVPRMSQEGGKTNAYFVELYQTLDNRVLGISAREHTAQVSSELREEREKEFRTAKLPILYCSPTMELGIDISELNVVNMRNVPPTPANYAQRSGRAGRTGQPALVFTYCTIGSPHDQYYFKHPHLMTSGAVKLPRIDLTNEDLIRSHVHAIWLAESGLDLGISLKDLLDLSDPYRLPLKDFVQDALKSQSARNKAKKKAQSALSNIERELAATAWWNESWLDKVLSQIELQMNQACERWRNLYRAAVHQRDLQIKIMQDHSRSAKEIKQAEKFLSEANSQLSLLTETENIIQSDFYSYRYFASEGFLPGYSFPRLPLSAYIPARYYKQQKDEFLSRPRFLAISEFGPHSIIYHEGVRYLIHKVNLPISDSSEGIALQRAKQCSHCGYLHPITMGDGIDICEHCGALLDSTLRNLFRLQNVSTKLRERISSDEEERLKIGYELRTAVRFAEVGGGRSARVADVFYSRDEADGDKTLIATLTYGNAATLWRINLGWRRRAVSSDLGFDLDIERGYWSKEKNEGDYADQDDEEQPSLARKVRVIPFVEDHKNCLIFEPKVTLERAQMASLQAALKNAIQVEYQLEDNELAAEPLPDIDNQRYILFYESAEGGAGVLRQLVDKQDAFARVAVQALKLCHFDPITAEDLKRAPQAKEDCEAACYDCLMSYYNQRDHRYLDRYAIKEFLRQCSHSITVSSAKAIPRAEHYAQLCNLCQSELEREWLAYLEKGNYRLPTHAQYYIESCRTRPDFFYENEKAVIYVDGPHHKYPERQQRDQQQKECMEDMGYTVLRFTLYDHWDALIKQYPSIFGGDSK